MINYHISECKRAAAALKSLAWQRRWYSRYLAKKVSLSETTIHEPRWSSKSSAVKVPSEV